MMNNLYYGDCIDVNGQIFKFLYYSMGMNLLYVERPLNRESKYSINNLSYKKIEWPKQ